MSATHRPESDCSQTSSGKLITQSCNRRPRDILPRCVRTGKDAFREPRYYLAAWVRACRRTVSMCSSDRGRWLHRCVVGRPPSSTTCPKHLVLATLLPHCNRHVLVPSESSSSRSGIDFIEQNARRTGKKCAPRMGSTSARTASDSASSLNPQASTLVDQLRGLAGSPLGTREHLFRMGSLA